MTKREVIVWAWNAFKGRWEECGSFPNRRDARARRERLARTRRFCIIQEADNIPPFHDPRSAL